MSTIELLTKPVITLSDKAATKVAELIAQEGDDHLAGATLDHKDGLMDPGFRTENPNAQRSRGCWQSFS